MPAYLRAIRPEATREEVAAIVAALSLLSAATTEVPAPPDELHEWVRAARLRSRRVVLQRGPWRMSARIDRRARP
jgi:hypothetical protein